MHLKNMDYAVFKTKCEANTSFYTPLKLCYIYHSARVVCHNWPLCVQIIMDWNGTILHTIFCNAYFSMKMLKLLSKFLWCLLIGSSQSVFVQVLAFHTLLWLVVGWCQAILFEVTSQVQGLISKIVFEIVYKPEVRKQVKFYNQRSLFLLHVY